MSDSSLVLLMVTVPMAGLLVLLVVDRPRRRHGRHRDADVSSSGGWRLREIHPRRRCWQRRSR